MYAGQWRRHPVAIKVVAQSAPLDGSLLAEFHREVPPPGRPAPAPAPAHTAQGAAALLSLPVRGKLLQRQTPSEAHGSTVMLEP